jgi:hypothetical protein
MGIHKRFNLARHLIECLGEAADWISTVGWQPDLQFASSKRSDGGFETAHSQHHITSDPVPKHGKDG